MVGEEGFREGGGQAAAGDGDLEGLVALEAGLLALQDVGAQAGGEGVDVLEGVEVGRLGHDDVAYGEVGVELSNPGGM